MLKNWGFFILTLLAGIILAVMASSPPSPKGMDTPADQFSSGRAMADIRIIAAKPHPTGSTENAKVRAYLMTRLSELGLETFESESLLGERALKRLNSWSGESKTEQAIVNVIGVLHGQDRAKPALLLMAHHDTVWDSPGAADDTMGIAVIFETIRALNEDGPPARDLIVLLTDGEEVGLSGAKHFFKNNPLADKVGAIINFEARGGGGTSMMFQTSDDNGALAKVYARAVKQPATSSASTYVYRVLPNDTDLTPALERDYAAFNISNIGRAEYYHSPKSDAGALEEATLQHMGSQGLDLTRALLAAEAFPAEKPDVIFFDVFGFFTAIYPAFLGWVCLLLGAGFYWLSRDKDASLKAVFGGALRMLAFLIIGGIWLYALNWLSGNNGSENYYDRLAAIGKLEALGLISCAAMFFMIFGQKRLSANARIGAAAPLFILGIAGQVVAPTAVYFITLALLMTGLTSWIISRSPGKTFSIFAALIIGYMLFLIHLLMLGVGPNLLPIITLPAALIALAISPIYPGLPKRTAKLLSLAGLAIGIALALWIRLDPIAVTVPTY